MHGHGICFEEASESCHLGLAQNRKHQQVVFWGAALGEGFCFFRKCFDGSKSGILDWCSLALYMTDGPLLFPAVAHIGDGVVSLGREDPKITNQAAHVTLRHGGMFGVGAWLALNHMLW